MSHGTLRQEKNCLNCGNHVEKTYCPICGQENTITRQPFYFLITHFVEDFLHYDGGFWRTIKRLFFRPGQLTVDYLNGKRIGQVNPVKLYIFVSFLTFFLMAMLPGSSSKPILKNTSEDHAVAQKIIDSLRLQDPVVAESLKDFDLYKVKTPKGKRGQEIQNPDDYPVLFRPLARQVNRLIERGWTEAEVKTAFVAKYTYYFPKVLFLFLPVFAFFLWLFYDKKKFWYFDHGIFTLHFLTMSLISISLLMLFTSLQGFMESNRIVKTIIDYFNIVLILNIVVNFYVSAYRCYQQSIARTLIKGSAVLLVNTLLLFTSMIVLVIVSFMNI